MWEQEWLIRESRYFGADLPNYEHTDPPDSGSTHTFSYNYVVHILIAKRPGALPARTFPPKHQCWDAPGVVWAQLVGRVGCYVGSPGIRNLQALDKWAVLLVKKSC